MRYLSRVCGFCLVGCFALRVAVADPPPPSPPAVEAAAPDASAPAAPSTATAPAAKTDSKTEPAPKAAANTANNVAEAQIKKYRAQGYKPVVHDGTTVFCRSEATLGSRLEHQVCRTADQMEAAAQAAQDWSRDIQRGSALSNRAPGN